MKTISPKPVALITGASSGFGFEAARLLAEKGYRIYATYRNPKKIPALKELSRRLEVYPLFMEVTKTASVDKAVKNLIQKEGRIDVLINNAGFAMAGFLEDLSDQDLKDQFDTNVFGYLRVIRAVAPVMRARGFGKIINIGSISGRIAFPGLGAYAASKFAVRSLSEGLRQELRPFGVEVAEIAPGTYSTQVTTSARYGQRARSPQSAYKDYMAWMEKTAEKEFAKGKPASELAELIWKILNDSPMEIAYVAGGDAKVMAFLKWLLPDSAFEWLFKLIIPWNRFPRQ